MNERQLIDGLILKDERAFYTLYHMYHPLVYYVILQMLRHKDNANHVDMKVVFSCSALFARHEPRQIVMDTEL